jgi:hypothetical protein
MRPHRAALGALLVGEAWAALIGARLLMMLPYRVWRGWVTRMMGEGEGGAPDGGTRAVVWAIERARRAAPGTTCLTRALAAGWMLRRRGQRARLIIGVKGAAGKLEAHAWLELGGVVIVGGEAEVGRYARMSEPGQVGGMVFR